MSKTKKAPGSQERRKRGAATQEKLLDIAEALFARRGYEGVTIREVTRTAGVDVALAHYYFQNKQGLFDAVFTRRAKVLNEERLLALGECLKLAESSGLTLESIMDAFLRPLFSILATGDPGWNNYFQLTAQVNNNPHWGGQVMNKYFDPVIQEFISAIRRVLPDAANEDLYWSYHFMSGALTLTFAETGRIDTLSGGLCKSTDIAAVQAHMPIFMAAGFRATCQPKPKPKPKRSRT